MNDTEWNEPEITINGKLLTEHQSMTIRVALNVFLFDLRKNGCGYDNHGKEITKLYLNCIGQILKEMHAQPIP